MAKTNIESFVNPDGTPGEVWNVVKGCNGPAGDGIHCSYCYACKFVKRFTEIVAKREIIFKYKISLQDLIDIFSDREKCIENKKMIQEYNELLYIICNFKPHFFEYVYAQKLRVKSTMYFFSMSDPADWEQKWYEKIVEKIWRHPQHTFVILTKRPKIYQKYRFPQNCWLGVTITTQKQLNQLKCDLCNYLTIYNTFFLSIEPIQEEIKLSGYIKNIIDWIAVGPETGTKKKTPVEWLEPFFDLDIPVFMKNACSQFVTRPLRQEWPEGYLK